MGAVLRVNPPARELGTANAVLWGRGARRHRVDEFAGPTSVKCVLRGEATWTTRYGRFPLRPGEWLVLNEGQSYSLDVDSDSPVETFCVFFGRGFLDEPLAELGGLLEARRDHAPLLTSLQALRARLAAPRDELALESSCADVASALADSERRLRGLAERIPALRPSTRAELLKRVLRGRDYVEASLSEPLTLAAVAREACLSPFHFHRLFREVTGQSLHHYVRERRLARAWGLLLSTALTVTEVAPLVGFESLGSFTSAFTRRYGSPPGRLRRAAGG